MRRPQIELETTLFENPTSVMHIIFEIRIRLRQIFLDLIIAVKLLTIYIRNNMCTLYFKKRIFETHFGLQKFLKANFCSIIYNFI